MDQRKKKQTSVAFLPFVAFFFLFPVASRAQQPTGSVPEMSAREARGERAKRVLTLPDALRLALDHQPRIRAARERVKVQQAVLGQAKAAYYPAINFNNSYRTTTGSGTTRTSVKAFDFVSSAANFDWTIYDFGKREGNVKEARETLDSQRFAQRTSIEGVILNVKRAYYSYLQAKALVRVREDTVKDRELLVRQARGFFEVGTRPKIDVARAESALFGAKANLIAAENGVKIAWAELKNAIGLEDFPVRPLAEEALIQRPVEALAEELAIRKPALSLEEAQKIGFGLRPELKDFEAQRRAQDADIAVARRGHLPNILFDAAYGRRQSGTAPNQNVFPMQENWSVQISFNIPIFSGFQTAYEVEEALRNYHEIRAREEETRQQIALDIERSYLNVIEAAERIKATEAAVRAAKENLALANGRYQVGVGSIIEITEAQVINTEAQTNHIQSIYDHTIAQAELAKAMGQGITP